MLIIFRIVSFEKSRSIVECVFFLPVIKFAQEIILIENRHSFIDYQTWEKWLEAICWRAHREITI